MQFPTQAQSLPDPSRAKALDKCHILIERAGAKFAVKKLKTLGKCTDGIFKCLQTKPGVTRCLDQARDRCDEQLIAGAAEEAKVVDTVVRKCGSDSTADDLLTAAGLDVASLADECSQRFAITLTDLTSIGTCLARRHACELERLFASAAPRAATLMAVAGVDAALRGNLTCLTDHGGSDEHVSDPSALGRPLTRCARAVENATSKLVDASLKATGRCLDILFTCAQVKTDPAAAPACAAKARKRCAVELANLAAAASRPLPAIASACGAIDIHVLRADEGLRLSTLDTECTAVGAGAPTTQASYADCLIRQARCGVVHLARVKSPRGESLLFAATGTSLLAALCPSEAPPAVPTTTPTALPSPSPSPTATPTTTATSTDPTPTATGPTPTPTPGCADAYEPSRFPDAPVNVSGQCTGGCTDDGFNIIVDANIDGPDDASDFYVVDVTDLVGNHFALQARLSDVPDDTNYDLFLYRLEGAIFTELDRSTNDGTGAETVGFSGNGDDKSGRYGIEVRRIEGSSCELYRLKIENPN
ncbi:MAG: hypothetical protein ABIR79_19070 [Candidatus Binatia bacterium]